MTSWGNEMRFAVFCAFLIAFCCSGCVNIGDVALIADYDPLPGKPGGNYHLHAENQKSSREFEAMLSSTVARYNNEHNTQTYTYTVPVNVSIVQGEPKESFDLYEALSGLVTFGTLGLWPTVMSDTIQCELTLKNRTLCQTIPIRIKKRYTYGWLSCLPVIGWAEWRGKESDFLKGESKFLKKVIEENLRLSDYQEHLVSMMIEGKDVLMDESLQRQDLILRKYALQYAPEKWQEIQQIRADSALMQKRIARMHNELKTLGYVPGSRAEFIMQCDKFFSLVTRHRAALINLEQRYLSHEYNRESSVPQKSESVTMEDILQGK